MALVRTSQLCSKGRLETYSLSNDSGLQVEIINLGASIRRFLVPDKNGDLRDIVLGYEQAQDYFQNTETFLEVRWDEVLGVWLGAVFPCMVKPIS
ncbi:hypothetical protein N1496_04650 [Streptococcus didelphis]|uniref:Uncharacterized protein n=1 Tax=Streptococcus didelphis TaxID=102886 RepID=A0ABY9LIP2_9STRE|nr:hypothetical protein [Streptococcus didelphis]WMB28745.1 hypothetical protein N1496_04650 [Streptococcus didelphis]